MNRSAPPDEKPYVFDLDPPGLRRQCEQWQWPPYRADQILEWLYVRGVCDPDAMTNLPHDVRATLKARLRWSAGTLCAAQVADDGVRKLLIGWEAGTVTRPRRDDETLRTECVMIPVDDGGRPRRTA